MGEHINFKSSLHNFVDDCPTIIIIIIIPNCDNLIFSYHFILSKKKWASHCPTLNKLTE